MQRIHKFVAMGLVVGAMLAGGCQPWQQKYDACMVDMENLQALFDSAQAAASQCEADKQQLQAELAALREGETQGAGGLGDVGGVYDAPSGTITVKLASDVLFDSGKVDLKSASKSRLDRIAGIIKQEHAGKMVEVVGHTDTDPISKSKWADNWQLSTERALAVTRYLIAQGIEAKQLKAAGRSQYHPISNDKAQNRRVEIVVHTR